MKQVLLIGATSSVASNLARLFRSQGSNFYFMARDESKLLNLVQEFGDAILGWKSLDFTDLSHSTQCLAEAYATHGWFDLVVIAHGYLGDQLQSESDWEESLLQISVNYLSVVSQLISITTHIEALPNRRAHIAVISSVAGDRGRPRNYTYGSAKGAVSLYLQGLRSRLWGKTIVTTIRLGPVDTPMSAAHKKNALFISSERAAQLIYLAIKKRKGDVYVPVRWWFIMKIVKMLPELVFQKLSALSGR